MVGHAALVHLGTLLAQLGLGALALGLGLGHPRALLGHLGLVAALGGLGTMLLGPTARGAARARARAS